MTEPFQTHLKALQAWLDHTAQTPMPEPAAKGLSSEEKQQLQAVNKAIEQLTKLGVEIPSDLRSLKLRLSANDVASVANPQAAKPFSEVQTLIDGLRGLLKAARAIRAKFKSNVSEPDAPVRYGVTLKELLDAGLLSIEDYFELQWVRDGKVFEGRLLPNGHISVKVETGWKNFTSLSMAAVVLSGRNQNGWAHWRRINADGSRTVLKNIRAHYLKHHQSA